MDLRNFEAEREGDVKGAGGMSEGVYAYGAQGSGGGTSGGPA